MIYDDLSIILPEIFLSLYVMVALVGAVYTSKDEIAQRGGNSSMIHIDWMIGSGKIDVDGVDKDGVVTPIFKQGEWCN